MTSTDSVAFVIGSTVNLMPFCTGTMLVIIVVVVLVAVVIAAVISAAACRVSSSFVSGLICSTATTDGVGRTVNSNPACVAVRSQSTLDAHLGYT